MSDYMPEEVLVQILKRVYPISLLRFRCVSKSWKTLISSPHFVSMQTQHAFLSNSQTPSEKMLLRHYSKVQKAELYSVHHNDEEFSVEDDIKIAFPFKGSQYYFRVVGCCNGLVCLSDDVFGYTNVIMLWNPLIRRKITLPLPQGIFDNLGPYMFLLGFGYDVKKNDFKVVRIAYDQRDSGYNLPPKVELYFLSIGGWREISGHFLENWVIEHFWRQSFVNGKVHWIAYRKSVQRERENLIMVFDMSDEVFEGIMLPNALVAESPINMSTAVYEDSIAVLRYDLRIWSRRCSIWVMKEYGVVRSWRKMFNIDVRGGLGLVLGFRKHGNILVTAANGEVVSYDPRTRGTVGLGIFGTKSSSHMEMYSESLALLVEGEEALTRQPNESELDSSEDGNNEEDNGVEKSEFLQQGIILQYVTAFLGPDA